MAFSIYVNFILKQKPDFLGFDAMILLGLDFLVIVLIPSGLRPL